ncbi:MAG: hypothetical protein A2Z14_06985 [Chloroflexi bacterium RBG_16_48_8]|nr:MAG: hypothetical protein A2Z14_06985 [Chloroflexi bacterium RBG_16_48_8]
MKQKCAAFLLLAALTTGCSLAGDFTPPPALATSQAAQSLIQPTIPPSPTATAAEEDAKLEQDTLEDAIIQGSIRGQISNGFEGGILPDNFEVTLYGFDDQQEVFSESTTASESGEYEFLDVEVQPGRVYAATVEYHGTIYASEVTHITEEAELDLPIMIFESTTDVADVQVDRIHVILEVPSEGVLQITELWILSNLGDRTIASESGDGILAIEIPDGAVNLSFESGMLGARFQVTDGGFIDLFPIRPGMGTQEIVFSFNMPLDQSLDFSQSIAYPVEAVVMLTPEGIVELKGEGVQDSGLRQMTGATLRTYNAGPLSPGKALEVTVQRQSGAGTASSQSNAILEIGIGVVLLLVALGGTGFWLYRKKQEAKVEMNGTQWTIEPKAGFGEELQDRDRILQTLADLDDHYETGEIKDAFYRERRVSLKNQLLEIMHKAGND